VSSSPIRLCVQGVCDVCIVKSHYPAHVCPICTRHARVHEKLRVDWAPGCVALNITHQATKRHLTWSSRRGLLQGFQQDSRMHKHTSYIHDTVCPTISSAAHSASTHAQQNAPSRRSATTRCVSRQSTRLKPVWSASQGSGSGCRVQLATLHTQCCRCSDASLAATAAPSRQTC
jgi:hypothetical protein